MIKILGIGDVAAALLFGARALHFETSTLMTLIFAFYLIIKGLIFFNDIASFFDILGGIFLLISLALSLPSFLFGLFALYLLIKGFLSLF